VEITAVPERMRVALAECRICFMFAQVYHSAMRHVAPIRRELGIRTIFNLLGPLTNPAGIKRQLVGVGSELAFDLYPETLRHLGVTHALVVRGYGGLDEITPFGSTRIREVTADGVKDYSIHPRDFGRPEYDLAGLAAGDSPAANAHIMREVLGGIDRGARREAVLYNAAAGLLVGGRVNDLASGIALAEETIDSGEASRCLAAFVGAARPIDPSVAG
jgi:anthranilate phosphoribosyltransferase